jgi:putative tryptophan/tyrosine transport system substrate-binding protein
MASMARVPAIYPKREYVDDGGLIAYGPNVSEHFRQAASYVDRILRGADPGNLPISATTKFDFLFNPPGCPGAWTNSVTCVSLNC